MVADNAASPSDRSSGCQTDETEVHRSLVNAARGAVLVTRRAEGRTELQQAFYSLGNALTARVKDAAQAR